MEHHFDRGVAEQPDYRRDVDGAERVDQGYPVAGGRVRRVHHDLYQAQQRAVAALRHELGVDADASALARRRRGRRHVLRGGQPPVLHEKERTRGGGPPRAPCGR